jgi:hypothetical protein
VLLQYLKEHYLLHSDVQTLICGIGGCEKAFNQRGKLSFHRRTHAEFKKKNYTLLNKAKKDHRVQDRKIKKASRKQDSSESERESFSMEESNEESK